MPMYMPHMNSLASTMQPGVLYTDADTDDNANDANNKDDDSAKITLAEQEQYI